MKYLLMLFMFMSTLIVISPPVYAQTDCGLLNNQCCTIDISKVNINAPISTPLDVANPNEWGCLGPFCISQLFKSAQSTVKNVLDRGDTLNELGRLNACKEGTPSMIDVSSPNCRCMSTSDTSPQNSQFCNAYLLPDKNANAQQLLSNKEYVGCVDCFAGGGFWSALGCVYTNNISSFIQDNIFGLGLGLAGFVSLLCIIYSAFNLQLSRGNPEKIKNAQQMLTSCIMGLVLIIFSVFILRTIGVNILRIPGFQ